MLRLFKINTILVGLFAFMTLCFNEANAQVTEVDYQAKYNDVDCLWDFYIIIQEGTATSVPHRAQFNSQYSIVIPTGTVITGGPVNHMPLQNNQTYTGTIPLKWTIGTPVVNPAASPGNDFYGITPTLSPASFYNNLAPGDTIKIFSLNIGPVTECGEGVRIFNNVTDPPSSAPGMGGGDFSNGFTIGGSSQTYNVNAPKVNPLPPVVDATNMCTDDLFIDLDAVTSACQEPMTYEWTGPAGFTSTDEDVTVMNPTEANNGTYFVTVTDAFGCTSDFSVIGEVRPDAGMNVEGCPDGSVDLQGANPSDGTWTADMTNASGATLVPGAAGAATVNFGPSATGSYNFIYTNIVCSDTMTINIIMPDAGPEPSAINCFSAGSAAINADASQSGVWSVDPSSDGTANIDNPSSASTFVSGFSVEGDYILVWTVGACSDFITITTNNNCACAITNNVLQSLDPNTFCGSSGNVLIDGNTATPSGSYLWEYSLDGGTFGAAPGANTSEDYTTNDLSEGSHNFRRLYTTDSGIICSDTSNIVGFDVFDNPLTPTDLTASPSIVCVSQTTNLSVTNNPGATYTWSASSPLAGLGTSTTNIISMTPTAAGTYTISVTQTVNGCESPTATIDITVSDPPPTPTDITTTSTNSTTCGADDGTITISGYTPNETYTVLYSIDGVPNSMPITADGSGNLNFINLAPASYTNFQIVSAIGCASEVYPGPVLVTDPVSPPKPLGLMADPNPECLGSEIIISVDDSPGATFNWSANSPNAGLGTSSTNEVTMNATVAGFYTITVNQIINGCVSPDTSISISVTDSPPTATGATVSGTNPSACGGMDGFISMSGYLNSTSYTVMYAKNGMDTSYVISSNLGGVIVIPDLTEGTYSNFSVTNNIGCSSGVFPGPISLSDPGSPNPPLNLTANPNPVCLGNTVTLSVSNTPGATFNWSASSPDAGIGGSTGNINTMDATVAGTYTINVSVTVAGCTSSATSIDVVVGDTPATPSNVTPTDPTTCAGTDGMISISGYTATESYDLDYSFNGGAQTITLVADGSGNLLLTDLTAGTYSDFQVTNAANCPSGEFAGPVTLQDPDAPEAPTGILADPNPICQGESMTISVDDVVGATFTWSISPADAGFGMSTTNSVSFTPVGSGVFVVSVFFELDNCVSTTTNTNAIVEPSPSTPVLADISSTNPTFCTGSDGTISISNLDPSVSYGIQYDSAMVTLNSVIAANSSGVLTITGLSAGSYSNIILTNSSGCSSGEFTGPVSLSDPGAPDAPTNLTGTPNPSCLGTTVNLSVTSSSGNSSGVTFNWSSPNANAGLVSSTTNTTTMLATVAGTYTILVTETIAGCTSPAAMIEIEVSDIPPTPTDATVIGVDPTDCGVDNGTITLSGLAVSTTYDLTYSTDGTPSTTSFTSNPAGEIVISDLGAGSYSDFSLENAEGCISGVFAGPIVLVEPTSPPAPTVVGTDPSDCGVDNGSILVSGITASTMTTLTYFYNGAENTGSFTTNASGEINLTGLAAGDYTDFSYITSTGCPSGVFAGPVTLTEPDAPDAPSAVGTNPTDCGVANGSILVSALIPSVDITLTYFFNGVEVTGSFTTNASGEINLTDLASGDYTNFSYVSASGCTSGVLAGPVTLSEPNAPAAPGVVGLDPSACGLTDGSITVSGMPSSISTMLTYSFNGTETTGSFTTSASGEIILTGLAAGDYTNFSYVSNTGCVSGVFAGPVTLVEPNAPAAPSAVGVDPSACGLADGSITVSGMPSSLSTMLTYSFNGTPTTGSFTTNGSGELILTGLAAGSYTNFSYVSSTGCVSGVFAGPVTLVEPNAPSAPSAIGSDPTACGLSDGSITVSGLPPSLSTMLTYSFNGTPTTGSFTTNGSGEINLTGLSAGSYTNFSYVSASGCVSGVFAGPVTLVEPNAPSAPTGISADPNPVCLGETVDLGVDLISGATYTWSASSANAGLVTSTSNSTSMTATAAGTYTITVFLSLNGCDSPPASIEVVIDPLPLTPTPGNINSTDPSACGVDDGTITISGYDPSEMYTINYTFNGSPVSTNLTADVLGDLIINSLVAGTYADFEVVSSLGCASGVYAGPVLLSDPGSPLPPTNLTANPNPICFGDLIQLSVDETAGATYNWSVSPDVVNLNGVDANISFLAPTHGIYTISVTQTIAGCTSPPASIVVLVKEHCVNPDFGVTYADIQLTGLLGTNDYNWVASTYQNVVANPGNPSGCAPVVSSDGSYTFDCSVTGEFEYTVDVCEAGGSLGCISVPLVITVLDIESMENPPIANHDYIATTNDSPIVIEILENDKCQSIPNCVLTNMSVVTQPSFGSFDMASMTYTPNNGYVGRDSFRYEVCQDPATPQSCDQEWVYIDVYPLQSTDFTNAMDDYNQTSLNTSLVVDAAGGVLANDTDPLNSTVNVDFPSVSVPGKGSIMWNTDGSYTFIPEMGFIGPVDFEYQVCRQNNGGICADATLHLLVEPQEAAGGVGSCVWEDVNADGILNNNEPGIFGVEVNLYTSEGELYASAFTDELGFYRFDDLEIGEYFLQFVAPEDFEFTFPNVGNDSNDSDVDDSNGPGTTPTFIINAGTFIDDIKAGLYRCNKIGENVWYDIDEDDVYDDTENGINGLKVYLYRLTNGAWELWDYTTTGKKPDSPSDDGWYQFCAPPGTYYIEIILPPTGLVQVIPFVGNNRFRDSDINNGNGPGTTNSFTIVNGQDKLDIGAGYYPMAEVGNLVWFDENFDGLQNEDEARIADVLVEVYDANTNDLINQATTNEEGIYHIDYLEKSDVYFKFTPPGDMVATIPYSGNDEIDSDVDHTYGLYTTRMVKMIPGNFNDHIDFGVAFGALPVDWLDVSVREVESGHKVEWKVEQEVNVDSYEVERSLNGFSNFQPVSNSKVIANNVTSQSTYAFVDKDALIGGTYYYRVKQYDFDGKFNYSPRVAIKKDASLETRMYPNPTTSLTNIDYVAEDDGQLVINIFDVTGKLVLTQSSQVEEGTGRISLDCNDLPEGAYNISIELNNTVSSKRLIKIK